MVFRCLRSRRRSLILIRVADVLLTSVVVVLPVVTLWSLVAWASGRSVAGISVVSVFVLPVLVVLSAFPFVMASFVTKEASVLGPFDEHVFEDFVVVLARMVLGPGSGSGFRSVISGIWFPGAVRRTSGSGRSVWRWSWVIVRGP